MKSNHSFALQHDTRHTLTYLLSHNTFDPWMRILIAGEWSFDRLSLFFCRCRQCVADKVAPLSQPAKIWNWRIIVSPSRVAALFAAIFHGFQHPSNFGLCQGNCVSTADVKAFCYGNHWCQGFVRMKMCTHIFVRRFFLSSLKIAAKPLALSSQDLLKDYPFT